MAKKSPFVAVRTDIRKEERVLVIADIAGYSRHEAIGRLVDLWAWCTDRDLEDAPDDCEGYAVSDAVVCRFLGRNGVVAILGDHVDELALGQRRDDGLIYLRGTSETVARLRSLRKTSSAGGNARNKMSQGKRVHGRFASGPTNPPADDQPTTSNNQRSSSAETSRPPATTSEIPDPTVKRLSPAHDPAVPSVPVQAPGPQQASVPETSVTRMLWGELEEARSEAGADMGIDVQQLPFGDGGERLLADMVTAARGRGEDHLDTLIGQSRHAIEMAKQETVCGEKAFEWFSGAVFSPNNFRRLVAKTAADFARSRAGPRLNQPKPQETTRKITNLTPPQKQT